MMRPFFLLISVLTTLAGWPAAASLPGRSPAVPRVRSGHPLTSPPLARAPRQQAVDVLAYWYNDWGLEATRAGRGATGAMQWYDWSWNRPGTPTYDASRHPLLGWYHGDDSVVLDWQCYWLREFGVRGVIPSEVIDVRRWTEPRDHAYWIYQLLHRAPNCRRLGFVPWVEYSTRRRMDGVDAIAEQWRAMIQLASESRDAAYTIRRCGADWLVVFLWDEATLRAALEGIPGNPDVGQVAGGLAFLAARGLDAQAAGFGGLIVLSRNPTRYHRDLVVRQAAASSGGTSPRGLDAVLLVTVRYGEMPGQAGVRGTYADLVRAYSLPEASSGVASPPQSRLEVANVLTSAESKGGHPSRWAWSGSTPASFRSLLSKAVRQALASGQPHLVTVYNVSEWAEGGPGLQPNRRDGFAYLEAVRSVLREARPGTDSPDPLAAHCVSASGAAP